MLLRPCQDDGSARLGSRCYEQWLSTLQGACHIASGGERRCYESRLMLLSGRTAMLLMKGSSATIGGRRCYTKERRQSMLPRKGDCATIGQYRCCHRSTPVIQGASKGDVSC